MKSIFQIALLLVLCTSLASQVQAQVDEQLICPLEASGWVHHDFYSEVGIADPDKDLTRCLDDGEAELFIHKALRKLPKILRNDKTSPIQDATLHKTEPPHFRGRVLNANCVYVPWKICFPTGGKFVKVIRDQLCQEAAHTFDHGRWMWRQLRRS